MDPALLRQAARLGARTVLTLVRWAVWCALGALLAAQVYVASTHEFGLPRFVRDAIEERLASAGVHATFGRATFDPSGHVLIERVALFLPGYEEPVATARTVYMRLNPLAMIVRRFEWRELWATGVSLRVPAMLSPSGRSDEIVRGLDMGMSRRGAFARIDHCTFLLGNLEVTLDGTVRLRSGAGRSAPPTAAYLVAHYGAFARRAAGALAQLEVLDRPRLRLSMSPASESFANLRAVLEAGGATLSKPIGLRSGPFRASASFEIRGESIAASDLSVEAAGVDAGVAGGVSARGVRAWLRGGRWEATAATVTARGVEARDVSVAVGPAGLLGAVSPSFDADILARLWEEPLAATARVDLGRRSAQAIFRGALGQGMLAAAGARLGRDLGRFVRLSAPVSVRGEANWDPGWKFAGATGRASGGGIDARGVRIDEIGATLLFDGRRLVAPEAFARVGDDVAAGRFEQVLGSNDYRFLLRGRLRPLDISPWIAGDWWRDFFRDFAFPDQPPSADIDLQGCWTDARKAVVFVAVDSVRPVVRGVPFDRVRLRLFARPQFKDGLELSATRGPGALRGTFDHSMDFDLKTRWVADVDLTSTIGFDAARKLLGVAGQSAVEPFAFERAPSLSVRGRLEGPGNPGGAHTRLHIDAKGGAFRYEGFPLERVAFAAEVRDDAVRVDPISAGFAGGDLEGSAEIRGRGADRRLRFSATLRRANLRSAIQVLQDYSAKRQRRAPPPLGDFLKEKADVTLDASATAEGRFGDPFSFQGSGSASLQGPELGQVRMLGLLSELLRFTSLRFTAARATFKIEGPVLAFPEISVTGANSGIAARGDYAMDRHFLDFRARINPFQESKALPEKVIDVFLLPLSSALEVKLTGPIERPQWMFVNGPSNLLHNLGEGPAGTPVPQAGGPRPAGAGPTGP